jgi:hypothetical protein
MGRNQGASVRVERAIGARFAGHRGILGREDIIIGILRERKKDRWWRLLREIRWPDKEYVLRLVWSVMHEARETDAIEVLGPGRRTAQVARISVKH